MRGRADGAGGRAAAETAGSRQKEAKEANEATAVVTPDRARAASANQGIGRGRGADRQGGRGRAVRAYMPPYIPARGRPRRRAQRATRRASQAPAAAPRPPGRAQGFGQAAGGRLRPAAPWRPGCLACAARNPGRRGRSAPQRFHSRRRPSSPAASARAAHDSGLRARPPPPPRTHSRPTTGRRWPASQPPARLRCHGGSAGRRLGCCCARPHRLGNRHDHAGPPACSPRDACLFAARTKAPPPRTRPVARPPNAGERGRRAVGHG